MDRQRCPTWYWTAGCLLSVAVLLQAACGSVPRTPSAELPIPGFDYDFGTLIDAQALGDLQSLRAHDRRVLRVEVDHLEDVT